MRLALFGVLALLVMSAGVAGGYLVGQGASASAEEARAAKLRATRVAAGSSERDGADRGRARGARAGAEVGRQTGREDGRRKGQQEGLAAAQRATPSPAQTPTAEPASTGTCADVIKDQTAYLDCIQNGGGRPSDAELKQEAQRRESIVGKDQFGVGCYTAGTEDQPIVQCGE